MNNALKNFLTIVYKEDVKLVLSKTEIKTIEKFYKNNFEKCDDFDEFLKLNEKVGKKIKSVRGTGIYCEIKRQFEDKKGLQPGTICECVLAKTIAQKYNLTSFADLFHTYVRELPANVIYHLRDDDNKILARYVYYNPDDTNVFLIQYGNPTSYDADLYINGELVKIEFKDQIARAGEKDFFFDEDGRLIYDEKSDYAPFIKQFNEETNIISSMGKNYKFNDISPELEQKVLKKYFDDLGFEVLVSLDNDSNLVAITIDCINNGNIKILTTEDSEIKTAGKNNHRVFTPKFLYKSINNINGNIDDTKVWVSITRMTDRIGRTKEKTITGKKINSLLFVPIKNIIEKDEFYVFDINNVRELKPTFSIHIKLIVSKDDLKKYYEKILF